MDIGISDGVGITAQSERGADVKQKIQAILEKRKKRLPGVQAQIVQWIKLDSLIVEADAAIHALRSYPRTSVECKDSLAAFSTGEIRKDIADAVSLLRIVENRFGRGTINIGISGRARVGKSTLLQTISGLKDEQIPTGAGVPVTAVRSRIFNSIHKRATLTLHTFETFREDVLKPYHLELNLEVPLTIEEFRNREYPASAQELADKEAQTKSTSETLLRRLREIQCALISYEKNLRGGERVIDLSELRKYIAYPTNEQEKSLGDNCPRCYLAVRDVRIECPFPRTQVDNLGIIDLPGLGELVAGAEEHHLKGLQNEVDFVILVKRAVEGLAFWDKHDGNAADLLDRARGVNAPKDFVHIMINCGENTDISLLNALRDSIGRALRARYPVLEADALNPENVCGKVIVPVLHHLSERLPDMDQQVLDETKGLFNNVVTRIECMLKDAVEALPKSGGAGNVRQEVDRRAGRMHEEVSSSLNELVKELQKLSKTETEDKEFKDAVKVTFREIEEWCKNGFGKGEEQWCNDALGNMVLEQNSINYAGRELNHIRVEISTRYLKKLNQCFDGRKRDLWKQAAKRLCDGPLEKLLIGDTVSSVQDGKVTLERFIAHADNVWCGTLATATKELLDLRLEYRSQLHPWVREQLKFLAAQVIDPETGKEGIIEALAQPATKTGAKKLYCEIKNLAVSAAFRTQNALLERANMPNLVLYAAAEQFEDQLIRSDKSKEDFNEFGHSFRDVLWPEDFKEIDKTSANVKKVVQSINAIREYMNAIKEVQA